MKNDLKIDELGPILGNLQRNVLSINGSLSINTDVNLLEGKHGYES